MRPVVTMSDLTGAEGERVMVVPDDGIDHLNAVIVAVMPFSGMVALRLADGSVRDFHWSRVRWL